MRFKSSLEAKMREVFGVDLRSLALFRIVISLVILGDLIVRATSLRAHYTDFGLLPRSPLIEEFSPVWRIDFHLMSGLFPVQVALFVAAAFLALMLLLGYRTRFAAFFSWIFLTSLHARNPAILQAGDVLLHVTLFWGLFLPLGARCSVDSLLKKPSPSTDSRNFLSMGSVGYLFQVAFVYWFTVAHKSSPHAFPIWWTEGSAVYYALNLDQFATPVAHFFLQFPPLVKFLNYATLAVEAIGPLLLFSPIGTGVIKTLGIFAIIALQAGFRSCLELGPFPFIAICALLPLLPSFFWEKLKLLGRFLKIDLKIPRPSVKISSKFSEEAPVFQSLLPASVISLARKSFPWAVNLFALFCLIYIFFWNFGNVNSKYVIPRQYQWFGILLNIDQRWDMFSPPLRDDGWYVIPGKLKNGSTVDLFKGGQAVSWEKPNPVRATYKSERWRKYMMNLWLAPNKGYRLYYGKYLCRNWNTHHSGDLQLQEFEIFFMKEATLPNYQPSKVEKVSIWKHWCFEVPKEVREQRSPSLGI